MNLRAAGGGPRRLRISLAGAITQLTFYPAAVPAAAGWTIAGFWLKCWLYWPTERIPMP